MLDTQDKIMIGVMGFHGDGFMGLDDSLDSPKNYAEYKASVESEGLAVAASEAELQTGYDSVMLARVEMDARRVKRDQLRLDWLGVASQHPDITGPMQHKFDEVNGLLDENRDAEASAVVQYADHPSAYTAAQIQVFELVKADMQAKIDAL